MARRRRCLFKGHLKNLTSSTANWDCCFLPTNYPSKHSNTPRPPSQSVCPFVKCVKGCPPLLCPGPKFPKSLCDWSIQRCNSWQEKRRTQRLRVAPHQLPSRGGSGEVLMVMMMSFETEEVKKGHNWWKVVVWRMFQWDEIWSIQPECLCSPCNSLKSRPRNRVANCSSVLGLRASTGRYNQSRCFYLLLHVNVCSWKRPVVHVYVNIHTWRKIYCYQRFERKSRSDDMTKKHMKKKVKENLHET